MTPPDYYALPNSHEPFNGEIVKLTGDEFDYLFQGYSETDEYSFREKLHRMDVWFIGKPYRICINQGWVKWVIKWLQEKDDDA